MKSEASGKPEVAGLVSQARDKLAEVDSAYSTMEHGKAIQPALEAHSLAKQASPGFVAPQDAARYLEDILKKTRSELAEAKSQIPLYLIARLAAGVIAAIHEKTDATRQEINRNRDLR